MKKLICFLSILTIAFCFSSVAIAAEHPGEHPGTVAKEHHGEHPGEKEMLQGSEIIKGIKDHIKGVTKANNGYYPLTDAKEGKDLKLNLVKVHEDKVSYIKKEDAYFACTDFVTDDGTKYDVDFWMEKNPEGRLEVRHTKIHKKQGIPRFTYQDDEIVELEPAMTREESTVATPKKRFIAPEAGT